MRQRPSSRTRRSTYPPAATQSAAAIGNVGAVRDERVRLHPGVVALDVDELGPEEVRGRGEVLDPGDELDELVGVGELARPVRRAWNVDAKQFRMRVVVAQVDAERVLHHQVVDLGAVEQPLHRRARRVDARR